MIFQRESAATLLDEGLALFQDHWLEVGHFRDIDLSLDAESYKKSDKMGVLRVYTIRKEDKLIGYSVYLVNFTQQLSTTLQASQNAIYISPSYRGIGTEFVDYCDKQLQSEGVDVVYQNVAEGKDWSNALKRLNYKKIETIYARRLS